MRSIVGSLAAASLAAVLTGCATVPPDVTAHYYFPKAETQLLVTETVGCGPSPGAGTPPHRLIRAVITVAPTTTNSADTAWMDENDPAKVRRGHLRYRDFSSDFSDEDITVALTADGRLSAINATSTGEGDTVVKNLVTVGVAAAAIGAVKEEPSGSTSDDDACQVIDNYAAIGQGGSGKVAPTVTLTYSVAFTYDFGADGKTPALKVDTAAFPGYADQSAPTALITLVPDPAAIQVAAELHKKLPGRFAPQVGLVTTKATLKYLDTVEPPTRLDTPSIELTRVAMLALQVKGFVGNLQSQSQVWSANVPAPTHDLFNLPIPKPATFGKTAFGLSLSDYGSVTSLHYGMNTPVADMSDAAGAIAKALQPATAEDRANDIKGQADLIAQQQRLISCEVDPKTCK